MAVQVITQFSLDEVQYLIDFLTQHLPEYRLYELTQGYCPDVLSVNNAHPLSLEYGKALAADGTNYTSILPAVGVELIHDSDYARQPLGQNYNTIEITQAFITGLSAHSMPQRFTDGDLISNAGIAALQAAYTAAATAGKKLYGVRRLDMQQQSLNVSVWTNNLQALRICYTVLRSLLKRFKAAGSAVGIKDVKITGQGGLYNYDFSETLYGAEFTLEFVQAHVDILVEMDMNSPNWLETLDDVELYNKADNLNRVVVGLTPVPKAGN